MKTFCGFLNVTSFPKPMWDFKNKNKVSLTLYEPKHYRLMKLKSLETFCWSKVHYAKPKCNMVL